MHAKRFLQKSILSLGLSFTLGAQAKVTAVAPTKEEAKAAAATDQPGGGDLGLNRSVNDSAQKATDWASIGNMAASGMGMAYMATSMSCEGQCSASGGGCCSQWPMWAMFGVQALTSAAQFVQSQQEAQGAEQASNGAKFKFAGLTGSGAANDPDFANTVLNPVLNGVKVDKNKINSMLAKLNSKEGYKGYKYDPKTGGLLGPDGKLIGGGSTGADGGGGLSKDTIAKAAAIANAIKAGVDKYAAKKGLMSEEGEAAGGGGGKSANFNSAGLNDNFGAGLGKDKGLGLENSRSVAGMSKDYFGEPIGVANDELFEMMKRRYQLKERQNSFFDEFEAGLQK